MKDLSHSKMNSKEILPGDYWLKYLVIPAELFACPWATLTHCMIFSLVRQLSKKNKAGCFASNTYFASILGQTERCIIKCVNQLIAGGFILKERKNKRRQLNINPAYRESHRESVQEMWGRIKGRKVEQSSIIHIKNNVKKQGEKQNKSEPQFTSKVNHSSLTSEPQFTHINKKYIKRSLRFSFSNENEKSRPKGRELLPQGILKEKIEKKIKPPQKTSAPPLDILEALEKARSRQVESAKSSFKETVLTVEKLWKALMADAGYIGFCFTLEEKGRTKGAIKKCASAGIRFSTIVEYSISHWAKIREAFTWDDAGKKSRIRSSKPVIMEILLNYSDIADMMLSKKKGNFSEVEFKSVSELPSWLSGYRYWLLDRQIQKEGSAKIPKSELESLHARQIQDAERYVASYNGVPKSIRKSEEIPAWFSSHYQKRLEALLKEHPKGLAIPKELAQRIQKEMCLC